MSDETRTTMDLVTQDMPALRREWAFERVGWAVLALLALGALAGAFGDGPLSHRTGRSARPGAVASYEGIVRSGAATPITITLAASSPDSVATLALDRRYLASVEVKYVTPDPVEVRASTEWVQYRVRRAIAGQSMTIELTVTPTAIGRLHGRLLTDAGEIAIHQFVLP